MKESRTKVYSIKDFNNIRKVTRDETCKWIDTQDDKYILQSIYRELDAHKITLTENERTDLENFLKSVGGDRMKKELKKFVKNISTILKTTPVDTLPDNAIPPGIEELNKKLIEQSKTKVNTLARRLKAAKDKANKEIEQLEGELENIYNLQLEMIEKEVEEIWKSNEDKMPERFAIKELQMIHSEMLAERQMQEFIFNRQQLLESLANNP